MTASKLTGWRTPAVILVCGCLIAMLTFGPRSAFGFFLTPMSNAHGWGREVFALAFAVQNLLWGLGQPIAGRPSPTASAPARVLAVGMLLYAAGLALMTVSTTPLTLNLTAGVLIGFGLSGCSFNIVLSAFGKLLKPEWRGLALGLGTGAGSFGQFLFAPFGVALIDTHGWQSALLVFGGLLLLAVPLALALTTPASSSHCGERQAAVDERRVPRSLRPPLLHPARARLLHLRISTRLRDRASSVLSPRPRPRRLCRRLDDRDHRSLQHRRLADVRLLRQLHPEALYPLVHLFRSRALHRGVHPAADERADHPRLRGHHRPHMAFHRAADVRPSSR